jgi:uncharacterized iron-regulated membrane protein
MRTFHRVAGAVLAAQLVAWIVTGLLFNVKFRYDEAYETLTPARPAVDSEAAWASPADALAAAGVAPGALRRLHLLHDNRGQLYLIEAGTGDATALYLADARTGSPLAPLDAAGAEAALRSALTASPNAARYGAVESAEPASAPSAILGRETDGWRLALDTGQAVTVNAYTSEITHTGFLNSFIDWTYRVHYMQYTPWKSVNIALICVFSGLALFMVVSGVTMLRGPRRRYGYSKRRIRL